MNRQVWKREDLTQEELESAKKSYLDHCGRTKRRKDRTGQQIEMRLTFDEWLDIWLCSGQLLNRGRSKGQYCMSRKGDLGHYEVGNVFIQLASQNSSDARIWFTHSDETKQKMSEKRKGVPNGKKGKKQNGPAWNKGKSHSPEQVEKMREAMTGYEYEQVTCPHCGTSGGSNNMKRYHFDRCKHRVMPSSIMNPNFPSAIGFMRY